MLTKFFRSARTVVSGPVGSIPAGQRIYAVGDIHGRADLLDDLLARIEADDAQRGPADTSYIFLGDLVDRGPESARVVEQLMRMKEVRPSTRFLLGNHEEVFLMALAGDLAALKFFLKIGGKPTVLSYDIDEETYRNSDYAELMELLQARVPPAHAEFLREFEDLIEVGDYVFVHAGVKPEVPLMEQKTKDLRWIREQFITHTGSHGKIIVHGHTISDDVELLHNRIGIDTGAYDSGKLSALGIEGDQRWVIQT